MNASKAESHDTGIVTPPSILQPENICVGFVAFAANFEVLREGLKVRTFSNTWLLSRPGGGQVNCTIRIVDRENVILAYGIQDFVRETLVRPF